MLDIPGLEFETAPLAGEIPFPCKYAPNFLSGQEADALFRRFCDWNFCTMLAYEKPTSWQSVSFAADPEHTQAYGGYGNIVREEDEHCDGPVFKLSRDGSTPEEIVSLSDKLSAYLTKVEGRKRVVNYLSVMRYENETRGINWHKHGEDNGIDTPVLIISTGDARDFYLGRQNGTKKPMRPTEWSRQRAEHGSIIHLPASYNDTHWHAILRNTAESRRYGIGKDYRCGIRISVNTKCLVPPKIWRVKDKHPRWAKYVGCKYGQFDGTPYGNSYRPMDVDGHSKSPVARNESDFQAYAQKKMLDPGFRAQAIKDLRGKHLLCWCIQEGSERAPFCHARVWLDVVNRPEYSQ